MHTVNNKKTFEGYRYIKFLLTLITRELDCLNYFGIHHVRVQIVTIIVWERTYDLLCT